MNAPTEPRAEPSAVALDATLWDEPTTGISQYARCLAGALTQEGVRVAKLGAAQAHGPDDAPRAPRAEPLRVHRR